MRKHLILGALLGSVVLLLVAESAQAQFYWGRRGGYRGGDFWGVNTPYFSYGRGDYGSFGSIGYGGPYYGSAGYGGPYYGSRWGGMGWSPGFYDSGYYNGFARPYRGFSLGLRPRYSQIYDSGIYYYSTSPTYSSSPIVTYPSSYVLDSSQPMGIETGTYQSFYAGPSRDPNAALVRVTVPHSNADVWFDGSPTQQKGLQRSYVTPPLDRNRSYSYTIKASWMDGGREVTQEKQVDIRAGQEASVSFTGQAGDIARPDGGRRSTDAGQLPAPAPGQPHSGKLASVEDGSIVMTEMDGTGRHTHMISPTTEILLDGRRAELSDLKPGMRIDVTTRTGDPNAAVKIEARSGAAGLGAPPPAPGGRDPLP